MISLVVLLVFKTLVDRCSGVAEQRIGLLLRKGWLKRTGLSR